LFAVLTTNNQAAAFHNQPSRFTAWRLFVSRAHGSLKFDWLLRSDIGQVIKTIVDDEGYPNYAMPKKTTRGKSDGDNSAALNAASANTV
jgi:hypothetical protein